MERKTRYRIYDTELKGFCDSYCMGYIIPSKMSKEEAEKFADVLNMENAYIHLSAIYDVYKADKEDEYSYFTEDEELEKAGELLEKTGCWDWADLIPMCDATHKNIEDYKKRYIVTEETIITNK